MTTEWVNVKTRLSPDEYQWLEQVAQQEDRSIANVLRRLVREKVVEKNEQNQHSKRVQA
jgi:hypothetical protein